MEKSGSSADVGTETPRHSLWSAAELAAMKLPGMPTSARAWYKLVERDKWPEKLVPGRGGRDGGKVRKYAPPPNVLALIEAHQRGEFVQAKGRANYIRREPATISSGNLKAEVLGASVALAVKVTQVIDAASWLPAGLAQSRREQLAVRASNRLLAEGNYVEARLARLAESPAVLDALLRYEWSLMELDHE